MPKIQTFDAPVGVKSGISTQRATADAFGGGAGLIQAGKTLTAFAGQLEADKLKAAAIQEKQENAVINQTDLDNQGAWDAKYNDAKNRTDANATNFTESILEQYDADMERQQAAAPNARVRAALKLDATRNRNTLVRKATGFEAVTRAKNQVNVYTANGDKAYNIVYGTPTEEVFQERLDGRRRELDNVKLPDGDKAALFDKEVKNLRFSQFSGALAQAGDAKAVDDILASRPVGELSQEGFARLDKQGRTQKSKFKTEARIAEVEHRQRVSAAKTSVRSSESRLSEGQMLTPEEQKAVQSAVSASGDPDTEERWFNVQQVGQLLNGWLKLPSDELDDIIVGLQADVEEGGATQLESMKLKAALKAISSVASGERQDQAAIDTKVSEALSRVEKRLATDANLSKDPDMVTIAANLANASPNLRERINEKLAVNQAAKKFANLPPEDLKIVIATLEDRKHTSDPVLLKLQVAQDIQAKMTKTINENYPDWQQHIGGKRYPEFDPSNKSAMQARAVRMEDGAVLYNKSRKFHTSSELAALSEQFTTMKSDEQLGFINRYIDSLTVDQAAIALGELHKSNPSLAYVGVGMVMSPRFALVGEKILRGQGIMAAEKGVIEAVTGISKDAVRKLMASAMLPVMNNSSLPPGAKETVMSAALAYIATDATTDISEALNAVLGGDDSGGGIQEFNSKPFIAPVGVQADDIEDAFADNPASLVALSADGSPPRNRDNVIVSGDDISDAGALENIGPNLYNVRMNSDGLLLQGAPGENYVLHITPERLRRAVGARPGP